jgi:hypothetical protein
MVQNDILRSFHTRVCYRIAGTAEKPRITVQASVRRHRDKRSSSRTSEIRAMRGSRTETSHEMSICLGDLVRGGDENKDRRQEG